ncbi:sigma-70 family RNA polymerase sigma factor [Trebonia sp.]|uniref:sigma-70 family RNA polymerase sigma factor n=1 Tax=Trebonia sp. TaxID=2767075 RepID=UPI00261E071D|nr:sigma-70 family RNA polymerase sigma factor [Trebonia sp.]
MARCGRPWLLGIATNLARGQRRAARRQRTALARLAVAGDLPDFADDVSGRLDDAARIGALHRALARLSRPEFEVLAVCVWSGLSYAEAAEGLGIPVGTVRSRLSRARAKLGKLTERELRGNPREPLTIPGQLVAGTANAGPARKFATPGQPGKEHREILKNHMLAKQSASKAAGDGGTRGWRPPARVLAAAAEHLAREAATGEPSPGQWIYYKTVDYGYPGVVDPSGVGTDEEWVTFDGSQTAYYQDGQLVTHTSPMTPPGPAVKPWVAWNTEKTAYDVLASLPTDPQALLAVIASQAAGQNAQNIAAGNPIAGVEPETEAQREFDYLTLILWNAASAGGQAIGVSADGGYDQLLIDPVSCQVIGIRQLSTGIGPQKVGNKQPGPAYPPRGTLVQEIVYAQTAEVPAPGDR